MLDDSISIFKVKLHFGISIAHFLSGDGSKMIPKSANSLKNKPRLFQVREDVTVGNIIGTVSGSQRSIVDNLIASNNGLHITYTLTSLPNASEGVFEIDQNTGSLVVAQQLDREQQSEYNLEIRALDTTSSNNPQSSAVTVKVEITDVNDNAPLWHADPILINVVENTPIRSVVYNFTAFDADSGSNGDVNYKILKQSPNETFVIDPLTGMLTLVGSVDYEDNDEYLVVVEATDMAQNVSDRLSSSVTARVIVTDVNDNAPVFVTPCCDDFTLYLSDTTAVGQIVMHVVATDRDAGGNGRIMYNILSGNEDGFFNMDQQSGWIELTKPLLGVSSMGHHRYINNMLTNGIFTFLISASDAGVPSPKETRITMKIVVQGSSSNPPRFLESVYHANISENVPNGNFVVRVAAKSFQGGIGE